MKRKIHFSEYKQAQQTVDKRKRQRQIEREFCKSESVLKTPKNFGNALRNWVWKQINNGIPMKVRVGITWSQKNIFLTRGRKDEFENLYNRPGRARIRWWFL